MGQDLFMPYGGDEHPSTPSDGSSIHREMYLVHPVRIRGLQPLTWGMISYIYICIYQWEFQDPKMEVR
jgi:hypothetical protein